MEVAVGWGDYAHYSHSVALRLIFLLAKVRESLLKAVAYWSCIKWSENQRWTVAFLLGQYLGSTCSPDSVDMLVEHKDALIPCWGRIALCPLGTLYTPSLRLYLTKVHVKFSPIAQSKSQQIEMKRIRVDIRWA